MAVLGLLALDPVEDPTLTTKPEIRSLPWLGNDCEHPRLPTLNGPWAIGCKGASTPNRALHLETNQRIEHPPLGAHWGHGDGFFVDHTKRQYWTLGTDSQLGLYPFSSTAHAPLRTDGSSLVVSSPGKLEWMRLGDDKRFTIPGANPAPWYAPAVSGDRIYWVQRGDLKTGEDLWTYSLSEKRSWPVAQSDAHERHVVAQGPYAAWLTDSSVHLFNTQNDEHRVFPGIVNSNEGLGLSDGVVCWEAHTPKDIDIFCSDGLHLERPGDQRHPTRWKKWLLFHEGNATLLYGPLSTMPEREAP
jgi:hypothetical protein